ncbi:MAG: GNAT family N-acetyltransferase [Acidimicrobiia bacterium]
MPVIRRVASAALTSTELEKLRSLLDRAFGDDPEQGFDEDDWSHALGGWHVVVEDGDHLLAHASVVRRTLEVDGEPWDTGYVEAVATDPLYQGRGIGTHVMTTIGELISGSHRLGGLGTGSFHFYERLGWRRWRGPSGVRTPSGIERTSEDDGFIMVLLTPVSSHLDLRGLITCDWREGDVW